jgi:hypothetical protein
MQKAHALKHRQPEAGWRLPGTALLWALPLFVPWLALSDVGLDAPARAYRALCAGTASVASILAIGLWAAWRTRNDDGYPCRRVVLQAFVATSGMLGVATVALARSGSFGVAAVAPTFTWMFCAFLLPFWKDDSDVVDSDEPETGWKRLFGLRVVYGDPKNAAVWVRMKTSFLLSRDIGYTPNLGHIWGRLALGMIFLTVALGLLVAVVAG